jgi:REP element-mobilizing transposase RayT
MAHRFSIVLIHLIFSTKNRVDSIPSELQPRLWAYLVGIGRNHEIEIRAVGGTSNHAHLLIELPADVTVAKVVQVLKANSSRWMGEHGIDFQWQEGYGAFSVSSSKSDVVKNYIDRQPQHHAKKSYEDEFLAMLQNVGAAYEEVFG